MTTTNLHTHWGPHVVTADQSRSRVTAVEGHPTDPDPPTTRSGLAGGHGVSRRPAVDSTVVA